MKIVVTGKRSPIRPSTNGPLAESLKKVLSEISCTSISIDAKILGLGKLAMYGQAFPDGTKVEHYISVPNKRLKKEFANDLQQRRQAGESVRKLANEYGMSCSYAYRLLRP